MKRIFYYIAGVCAVLVAQTACSPQFEDLFDKSASERLQESMDEAKSVLSASEKGWAMGIYYTHTDKDEQGNVTSVKTMGRLLFVKFNADGYADMIDYNNGGLRDTSSYSMDISQGPVLKFDTYSDVLGNYVDPGTWVGDMPFGTGNSGDFEFVLFRVSENEVILKGKKYGAKVMLRKITGDGEETALWRSYYDACNKLQNSLFAQGVSPVLKSGDSYYYTLGNPGSGTLNMYPYGSTNVEEMTSMPYLASLNGIDLMEDVTVGGKSVLSFVYDEKNMVLVSREHADVQIDGPEVYGFFENNQFDYLADADNVGGKFQPAFAAMATAFKEKYGGARDLASVGFKVAGGKPVLILRSVRNEARFTLPGALMEDGLVVENFDAAQFPEGNMDTNAKVFYRDIAPIKDFLALLPGKYVLTNRGGLKMSVIEMSAEANPADRFLLQY